MKTFTSFSKLGDFIADIGYGRIDDLRIQVDERDAGLRAAISDRRSPLRSFAQCIAKHGGMMEFIVLKVVDGLPAHGDTTFTSDGYEAVRSHKFN